MDFGNGRMNVHEARGNDEEMAVIEIEAVFLRKFVPDVFAEMGKVAVDDGASVGDAALVVAADGKSEASGLMVSQRLFHEEIEGSTREEAGFLVLEEVRVPDGDVNTGNAECDEEGQEKGLPVDGFEMVPAAIRAPERRRPSICSLFSLFSDVAAAMKQKTR